MKSLEILQPRQVGDAEFPLSEALQRRSNWRILDIFALNGEHRRAAELFDRVDSFEKAANSYRLAGKYNEGASALARGNLFRELVQYLKL
jgi:hypothetical protein